MTPLTRLSFLQMISVNRLDHLDSTASGHETWSFATGCEVSGSSDDSPEVASIPDAAVTG